MQEVTPGLHVGSQKEYETQFAENGIVVIHACKEPYHRRYVGYTTRGCPKDSPDYLYADRGTRLALNMVDARQPEFFAHEMIEKALDFLQEQHMKKKRYTMIHCNEGKSRAPGLALLYMATQGLLPPDSYETAKNRFIQNGYVQYEPGEGWNKHLRQNWSYYMERHHV